MEQTPLSSPLGIGSTVLAVVLIAIGLWANIAILRKAGRSPWWALLFLFPILYIVGVWAFAFARWPRQSPAVAAQTPLGGDPFNPRAPSPYDDRRGPPD